MRNFLVGSRRSGSQAPKRRCQRAGAGSAGGTGSPRARARWTPKLVLATEVANLGALFDTTVELVWMYLASLVKSEDGMLCDLFHDF